jgi:hypothetical protein
MMIIIYLVLILVVIYLVLVAGFDFQDPSAVILQVA